MKKLHELWLAAFSLPTATTLSHQHEDTRLQNNLDWRKLPEVHSESREALGLSYEFVGVSVVVKVCDRRQEEGVG